MNKVILFSWLLDKDIKEGSKKKRKKLAKEFLKKLKEDYRKIKEE